jgi:hypothetical protein
MKKKEAARDKARIEKKAVSSKKRKIQDEYDSKIPDSERNPNAKADMEKVLQALVPRIEMKKGNK